MPVGSGFSSPKGVESHPFRWIPAKASCVPSSVFGGHVLLVGFGGHVCGLNSALRFGNANSELGGMSAV